MPCRTCVSKAEIKGIKLKIKELKDVKNGVALMPGVKIRGDLTTLLFVLLIVTIFVSALVKILRGSVLNFIFPKALLLLMCGFTKCEVYQEHICDIITKVTSFEFQSHS